MNNVEAQQIIQGELAQYREWTYDRLCALVGAPERTFEVLAPSGVRYQVQISVFWDSKPQGDVRVFGSIDDGGWRSFAPLSDCFIKAPTGSFVGEG